MINPQIFRAYDIRGIAHKPAASIPAGTIPDLTPETIFQIGKGAGTHFKRTSNANEPHIAVSYDCRLSNPELAESFIKGLLETGCRVTVIGMVPTPMLYFAVCRFGFDGGASITASHNPKQYNGVKLVGKNAGSICGDELQEIRKLIENDDFESADATAASTTDGSSKRDTLNVFPAYMEKLLDIVRLERPLKIVVDAGNGAAGPYIKSFFEALGCEVTPLYCEPDGNFPNHEANPEELENLTDLIALVKKEHADVGLGFDGDGDRVGIVDENGKNYTADLLLLLLARDSLARRPGAKIVFDAKASSVLIKDIISHGGVPVMSPTGHSFIEKKMREEGAPLAGEISGHLFFAENYYGYDDAFLGAARLLSLLSDAAGPFSALFKGIPETACTPELKSPCPDDKKFQIVEKITATFVQKYPCITMDGVRVNFDANSWGAVRCSNTSPNLTIRFEAKTPQRLKEIVAIMLTELEKYPEIDLWWANEYK